MLAKQSPVCGALPSRQNSPIAALAPPRQPDASGCPGWSRTIECSPRHGVGPPMAATRRADVPVGGHDGMPPPTRHQRGLCRRFRPGPPPTRWLRRCAVMRRIIAAVKSVRRQRLGCERAASAGSADHHRHRYHWRRWWSVAGGKQDATSTPNETDRAKPAKLAVGPPPPRTQDYWHLRGG